MRNEKGKISVSHLRMRRSGCGMSTLCTVACASLAVCLALRYVHRWPFSLAFKV
jgi:hypothetical protein